MNIRHDVIALFDMNKTEGFDCLGYAAWPDPVHKASFDICENGANAVSWEATSKRATPDFLHITQPPNYPHGGILRWKTVAD